MYSWNEGERVNMAYCSHSINTYGVNHCRVKTHPLVIYYGSYDFDQPIPFFWEMNSSLLWVTHFTLIWMLSFSSLPIWGQALDPKLGQSLFLDFCWVYKKASDSCRPQSAHVNDIYWVYSPNRKKRMRKAIWSCDILPRGLLESLHSYGRLKYYSFIQWKDAHRMKIYIPNKYSITEDAGETTTPTNIWGNNTAYNLSCAVFDMSLQPLG